MLWLWLERCNVERFLRPSCIWLVHLTHSFANRLWHRPALLSIFWQLTVMAALHLSDSWHRGARKFTHYAPLIINNLESQWIFVSTHRMTTTTTRLQSSLKSTKSSLRFPLKISCPAASPNLQHVGPETWVVVSLHTSNASLGGNWRVLSGVLLSCRRFWGIPIRFSWLMGARLL
jgi:hypothetical protein